MNSPTRSAPQRTHISRVGDGYALIAPRLYVWDESLDEVRVWGAEFGALPGHRAWRNGRDRSPRASQPDSRR